MGRGSDAPGAAGLLLVDGVSLLRPDEQVFTAMLDGWRASSSPGIWRSTPSTSG